MKEIDPFRPIEIGMTPEEIKRGEELARDILSRVEYKEVEIPAYYVQCGTDPMTGEPLYINDFYDGQPLMSSYDMIYFTHDEAKELAFQYHGEIHKADRER